MLSSIVLTPRRFNLWIGCFAILGLVIVASSSFTAFGPAPDEICYINHRHAGMDGVDYRHDGIECINPVTRRTSTLLRATANVYIEAVSRSPDRERIVYTLQEPDGSKSILIAAANGTNSQRIGTGYVQTAFVWLDNQRLLVSGTTERWQPPETGEVFVYGIAQASKQPVIAGKDSFVFCVQDGTSSQLNEMTVFENNSLALGHLDIKENKLLLAVDLHLNLSQLPQPLYASCLSWTLDHQTIVLRRDQTLMRDLYISKDGGQTFQALKEFSADYSDVLIGDFLLSPDGQWVALSVGLGGPLKSGLPEGNWVALINTTSGTVNYIRSTPGLVDDFAWSPDNSRVAIAIEPQVADPEKVGREVYVIDVRDMKPVQITFDGADKQIVDWY